MVALRCEQVSQKRFHGPCERNFSPHLRQVRSLTTEPLRAEAALAMTLRMLERRAVVACLRQVSLQYFRRACGTDLVHPLCWHFILFISSPFWHLGPHKASRLTLPTYRTQCEGGICAR